MLQKNHIYDVHVFGASAGFDFLCGANRKINL